MQCSLYLSINNTFLFSFHLRNQVPFLLSFPEGFLPFFFPLGKKEIDWNVYITNLTHFHLNPTNFTSLSQNTCIFCKHFVSFENSCLLRKWWWLKLLPISSVSFFLALPWNALASTLTSGLSRTPGWQRRNSLCRHGLPSWLWAVHFASVLLKSSYKRGIIVTCILQNHRGHKTTWYCEALAYCGGRRYRMYNPPELGFRKMLQRMTVLTELRYAAEQSSIISWTTKALRHSCK